MTMMTRVRKVTDKHNQSKHSKSVDGKGEGMDSRGEEKETARIRTVEARTWMVEASTSMTRATTWMARVTMWTAGVTMWTAEVSMSTAREMMAGIIDTEDMCNRHNNGYKGHNNSMKITMDTTTTMGTADVYSGHCNDNDDNMYGGRNGHDSMADRHSVHV
ncbi:hypothetical protein CVT25_007508 [Psilocybe cyanescens]|uniref:Uncharacterized protein n=1 Tax=Psilocybe cyanescens TaxID=93625 RepID=A0A409WVS5_PSICY|nr:hypothetical protein CVT25_007508 [Psilocybe cyanescens]